jgi:hypothetical protein
MRDHNDPRPQDNGGAEKLMIDATHLKAHRTAASLFKKGALPRSIGRSRGGLTTKLQVVCEAREAAATASERGQATEVLEQLPHARVLLADRAYSSLPSGRRWQIEASPRAFLLMPSAAQSTHEIRSSADSATRSRTCSPT